MFNSDKRIPRSLKECYETDRVTSILLGWSAWLRKWGIRMLIILIVFGIISTISDGIEISDIDESMVVFTVITSAITWLWYAVIEYCAYNALALLIDALATIVQNTKITANIALYNAAKDEGVLDEENTASEPKVNKNIPPKVKEKPQTEHSWRCDGCGQMRTQSPCPNCGKE